MAWVQRGYVDLEDIAAWHFGGLLAKHAIHVCFFQPQTVPVSGVPASMPVQIYIFKNIQIQMYIFRLWVSFEELGALRNVLSVV